jgi:hypothetical protein
MRFRSKEGFIEFGYVIKGRITLKNVLCRSFLF